MLEPPRRGRRTRTLGERLQDQSARRRHRQHVDGRDAVGGRGSRRGSRFARSRETTGGPCSRRRRARCVRRSRPAREPRRQVYSRAGRPCPRCGDADPGARPGRRQPHRLLVSRLPAGRREPRPPRNATAWRSGHRTSTSPCARSASRRSRPSAARTCRSPSRSTRPGAGRRSTSTARSCGLRRGAGADAAPAARTRGTRSTTSGASPPPRSSRTPTRDWARPTTTRSSRRSCCPR